MATKIIPTIVILGPTASGKTRLSLEIAKNLGNVEIICADSRTIYKGMDVGTAKPTKKEIGHVPHHLLDILKPDQPYSAAQFQKQANQLIIDIKNRGNIPMLVGGSGLYVFSVIYNYSFPAGPVSPARLELQSKDINELKSILQYLDSDQYAKIDTDNPRRVIRAIETAGMDKQQSIKIRDDVCVIGLAPEMAELKRRIARRTNEMVANGLVDEVKSLINQYGADIEPFNTTGYREIASYLNGEISLDKAEELINIHTRQLAKKQMAWFKRSKDINWVDNYSTALKRINKFTQI